MKITLFVLLSILFLYADPTALAHQKNLANSRYWHLLLHMPNSKSEIDDPKFFIATNGKTDPKAELEATINAFLDERNRSNDSNFCKFPARRHFLEKELNLSFGEGNCSDYEDLIKKVDPKKVTLIFPSGHINSPASMFGHTFLRIDSSMESKLTSYAINYAAETTDTNGFLFAIKGLFGGYKGLYSMMPYYDKIKEYRDTESRDIWEYELNLTQDETMQMMRHIWELQHIYAYYYFFDENCSYNMLWLIEIARPTVHLRDKFLYYINPPETVREIYNEKLIASSHYRPSKRAKILAYEKHLTPKTIKAAIELTAHDADLSTIDNFSLSEKQHILEVTAEMLEYYYISNELKKDDYTERFRNILLARSKLGIGESVTVEKKANPIESHHTGKAYAEKGWKNSENPLYFGFRASFHDLSEDDTGHLMGAGIEFFDILLKRTKAKTTTEKLTALSLASIVPISGFFRPISWRAKIGWDREYGDKKLDFVTRIGAGSAVGNSSFFVYLLTEPEIRSDDIGLGFSSGAGINWAHRNKTYLEGSYTFYDKSAKDRTKLEAKHLWQLNPRFNIYVASEHKKHLTEENLFKVGVSLYF